MFYRTDAPKVQKLLIYSNSLTNFNNFCMMGQSAYFGGIAANLACTILVTSILSSA